MTSGHAQLPKVLATSVIRSSHTGEGHGGAYLVDLASGEHEQMMDWDDDSIDWQGRGAERGLRGIAFHAGRVLIAASDEVVVYSPSFERLCSIRNRYVSQIHEIFVDGDELYITSTPYDSVLVYDLNAERFTRGYCLRQRHLRTGGLGQVRRQRLRVGREASGNSLRERVVRIGRKANQKLQPRGRIRDLRPWIFDPEGPNGPDKDDTSHINNVGVHQGVLHASGTRMKHLMQIDDRRVRSYAKLPTWTHNAQPYRDGVIYCDTSVGGVTYADRDGKVRRHASVARFPEDQLEMAHLPSDIARPWFARGLIATDDGLAIVGSSPATISVIDIDAERVVRYVNLSMDIRNAIHGLAIWPYD